MINYYYVIYLKREGKTEIHAIPFDTKEKAKKFKDGADAKWESKGMLEYSKILKRDMSKHPNPHWL